MDCMDRKRRSRVRKELNKLVNRNASFLANFAESGYGCLTYRIGNALLQQLNELRKGRLGTGPHISQNCRYFLARKRLLRSVEKLTSECLDEGMTYLNGSGGPFLLVVMSQGLKCLSL